jgi:hypothetical protein
MPDKISTLAPVARSPGGAPAPGPLFYSGKL